MACIPFPCDSKTATVEEGGATTITALHADIVEAHILTRLDGPALACAATASSKLYALSSQEHLWASLCQSTWPSTSTPRIRHVISDFPLASRSFFSDCFTIPRPITSTSSRKTDLDRTPVLISAVDLHYGEKVLMSRVVETETESDWFRLSPFRVDMLETKEVVETPMRYPEGEKACEEMRLSWIVIDPNGKRGMNLSSMKAVSVQRHWLTGEFQVKFGSVVAGGDKGTASELVMCNVEVTWTGVEVRELCLQMEDMDGRHLNGRDSLGILQRALEGERERNNNGREERWSEFWNRKRERKEREKRREGALDVLCVTLAAILFAASLCVFLFWR